jgi:hypothetical protein
VTEAPTVELAPVTGIARAHEEWGCTCGPVAIAGALGLTLDAVRPAVSPSGSFPGYMGIRDVQRALERLGASTRAWSPKVEDDVWLLPEMLAALGTTRPTIVMLRWCGPWDGVPRAAATYRHLIAYHRAWLPSLTLHPRPYGFGVVLDANWPSGVTALWASARTWRNIVMPELLPARTNGRAAIEWAAEVEA